MAHIFDSVELTNLSIELVGLLSVFYCSSQLLGVNHVTSSEFLLIFLLQRL
jgi:hypothetical protein